jgi:outer membrane protein assembly factor BamB
MTTTRGRRSRVARTATALLAAAVLAGCWASPGQGPDRRSHNALERVVTAASAPRLAPLWEAQVAPADATGVAPVGDPVLSTHGVHVHAASRVHGFAARTGARLWAFQVDDHGVALQPFTDGGRVLTSFAAQSDVTTNRWVDGRTGEPIDGLVTGGGDVDAVDGRYVVGRGFDRTSAQTGAISLDVADRRDPAERWGGLIGLGGNPASSPPVTLGRQFVYASGWGPFREQQDVAPGPGVRAYPLADGRSDCGPDVAPYFACPAWAASLEGLGTPTTSPVLGPGEDALYVATGAGRVVALDAADGAIRWSAALGSPPADDPALAGGVLYLPLEDGRLVALPVAGCPATCAPAWSTPLGAPGGQPAVAGGAVVVGTDAGRLVALDAAGCGAATCDPLWEDDLGSRITGDPAISGGRVFAGTEDGRLVAYAPTPP